MREMGSEHRDIALPLGSALRSRKQQKLFSGPFLNGQIFDRETSCIGPCRSASTDAANQLVTLREPQYVASSIVVEIYWHRFRCSIEHAPRGPDRDHRERDELFVLTSLRRK
jgi:hypothetical protein